MNPQFPVTSYKPGSSRRKTGGKALVLAKALRNAETLTGDVITHVENISFTASSTGDDCAFKAITFLTGGGVSENNGADIPKLFVGAFNLASTGGLANLLAKKQKLFIFSVHVNFYFRESGTAQGLVDIYECIARRTCDTNEYGASYLGMLSTGSGRDTVPSLVNATAVGTTDPFYSPYLCAEFGKYFKIYKQSFLNINNGTTNMYPLHIPVNRLIDPDEIIDHDWFKGLSRMIVFKMRGDMTGAAFNAGVLNVRAEITYSYTSENVDGHHIFQGVSGVS